MGFPATRYRKGRIGSRPLSFERFELRRLLAVNWTGGAGDNLFGTAGNWNPSVPNAADSVAIANNATIMLNVTDPGQGHKTLKDFQVKDGTTVFEMSGKVLDVTRIGVRGRESFSANDFRNGMHFDRKRLPTPLRPSETLDQLAAWFVSVACNAARNWLRRRTCTETAEEPSVAGETLCAETLCDVSPTESEVAVLLDDLQDAAGASDIERLRILAGLSPPPSAIPPRTIRHWKQTLLEKYGDFFRDLD